ncbi:MULTISPECIES: myxosortase-dependent metalloprotease, MXAN_2677/MXAN_2678 family [Corallococcus]|uniref:myxosortase-dependent metalloprotease, MXAN_2677/MXAN_2678 family n=1 Tax=Corallococcus TaxID=83461 RepID=UPI00117F0896|nr:MULTISPECIES: myxosortase-dependent metalloprotease, MXAN_2677/MXAN_2678 family [Corallococcus]NBD10684.1 matrixin family metalloprotease [Corallococcus silvisoli]TSC32007.1 matrixin family metalloprotease [Corallococcus sp. Z5C101001]
MGALASWVVMAAVLGQSSAPYVRSRVTPGDASTQCLYWTQSRVTWQQSTVGNPKMTNHTEFDAISRSFQSWQNIFATCGNLSLVEGPRVDSRTVGYNRTGDNINLTLFRARGCRDVVPAGDACFTQDTCANTYDCWDDSDGTIAITLTTYDERTGVVYDSDISFNAARFNFTTGNGGPCGIVATPDCVETDVQNTATHEVGHFVGLDHTQAQGSTMNPSAPPGETSKRTIDSGSQSFVCAAYPKGSASQPCIPLTNPGGSGNSGGGCATASGGLAALPLLAAASLLARRRRGAR